MMPGSRGSMKGGLDGILMPGSRGSMKGGLDGVGDRPGTPSSLGARPDSRASARSSLASRESTHTADYDMMDQDYDVDADWDEGEEIEFQPKQVPPKPFNRRGFFIYIVFLLLFCWNTLGSGTRTHPSSRPASSSSSSWSWKLERPLGQADIQGRRQRGGPCYICACFYLSTSLTPELLPARRQQGLLFCGVCPGDGIQGRLCPCQEH
jgi:hypothetical protein